MFNLVRAIPTPYMLLALIALVVSAMGFGYVKGARHVQDQWDAATVKQELTVARIRHRQAEATVKVVTQYVDRVRTVRETGATIIKEVPIYVNQDADAACIINRGFFRMHDDAAALRVSGPAGSADAAPAGIALSTVAATVADNYERCHENAAQLESLQSWVSAMRVAVARQ